MQNLARRMVVGVLAILLARSACAFDTAHHAEMTWNALQREGFDEAAIRIVTLQNWLTDYYAGQEAILEASDKLLAGAEAPGVPLPARAILAESSLVRFLVRSGDLGAVENAVWLHFDNLSTTEAVDRYWNALVLSTASQLYRFSRQKREDPLAVLTTLGITLHAVQDFYTHSNWVAEPGTRCSGSTYSGRTWFDAKRMNQRSNREIFTGVYPDAGPTNRQHATINKDHFGRECWAESYALAYKATRQWVRAFSRFVNSNNQTGLWDRCVRGVLVAGKDADMLQSGLAASFRVSQALNHWQGPRGPHPLFSGVATDVIDFRSTESRYKAAFTMRSILSELAADVQGHVTHPLPSPIAAPTFDAVPDDENGVFVRIPDAFSTNSPTDLSCEVNDDMLFVRLELSASLTVGARLQQDMRMVTDVRTCRAPRAWRALWFVPKTTNGVDLTIALWNEGAKLGSSVPPTDPYRIDIEPADPAVDLQVAYTFSDGKCTLDGSTNVCDEAHPLTREGSAVPRGRMTFYVETRTFRPGP